MRPRVLVLVFALVVVVLFVFVGVRVRVRVLVRVLVDVNVLVRVLVDVNVLVSTFHREARRCAASQQGHHAHRARLLALRPRGSQTDEVEDDTTRPGRASRNIAKPCSVLSGDPAARGVLEASA